MTIESASTSTTSLMEASTPISEPDVCPKPRVPKSDFTTVYSLLRRELDEAVHFSEVSMLPGFTIKPTGAESGSFLVIDLGGSTLRICLVELNSGDYDMLVEDSWVIKDTEKVLSTDFFAMIALRVEQTLKKGGFFEAMKQNKDATIHTGITWSFPIEQNMPNNGVVNMVSKGYSLEKDIKGRDLKDVFESALQKQTGLHFQVDSIINDAVAVYVSALYTQGCKFGLVLGTGLNASMSVPKAELVERLDPQEMGKHVEADIVLNAELSFFGSSMASLATSYDVQMQPNWEADLASFPSHMTDKHGCFQPLEFMCSGRYISELVRLAIVGGSLHDIFGVSKTVADLPKPFATAYGLSGEFICNIYECHDYAKSVELFAQEFSTFDLGSLDYTETSYAILCSIIDSVISRAALLLSAALVALSDFTAQYNDDKNYGKVGYVGSLLLHFKSYRDKVEFYLERAAQAYDKNKIELVHIDNSSVLGAAISAASYHNSLI